MVGIFISGFSATSSGAKPGVHGMADDSTIKGNIPGKEYKIGHTQGSKAVRIIKKALKKNPCEPVVLVGHSFGGDTAIEIAQDLAGERICVDLLIQIDSVGVGDEVLPKNVTKGVNLWSTSREGLNGASNVKGSTNIGIHNTTHTDIDDDPATNPNTGKSNIGKNAWDYVKSYTGNLPAKGCNCNRYLGNRNTKEVHDLNNEQKMCQISKIKAGHIVRFNPDSLTEAHSKGYDNCHWCIGGSTR